MTTFKVGDVIHVDVGQDKFMRCIIDEIHYPQEIRSDSTFELEFYCVIPKTKDQLKDMQKVIDEMWSQSRVIYGEFAEDVDHITKKNVEMIKNYKAHLKFR